MNKMKVTYPKKNSGAICNSDGYTELHHILGRKCGAKNIVDEDRNLIELCLVCHNYHTDSSIMRRIAKYKHNEFEDWYEWCRITAQEIGTKPNWVQLCNEEEL